MSAAAASTEFVPRRSRLAELSAMAALFRLTVRQHLHGRRLIVLALLYALPCALALLLRWLPRPPRPDELEFGLVFNLVPHGLAPLTALLYAAGAISDEVEEQTLTYLLMRSIPRWAIYVVKLLATWCVATVLVSLAITAIDLSIYAGTTEFQTDILADRLPRMLAITALAQLAYCAVFGFIGLATRRSLVAGLVFIVVIEGVLTNLEFVLRTATVVFYVRTLILHWIALPASMERDIREWQMPLAEIPTASEAVQRLLLAGVIGIALGAWWFARREFRVKTPEGS